jgi:acyl-CoA dehydrogenase
MTFELQMDLGRRFYSETWLEVAAWYRHFALEVINSPDVVLGLANHPLVMRKIEAEFAADTRQRAAMFEAMAYGDPSFLLSTPGPSLSGVLLQALGDERQQTYFHDYVVEHRCRTFFAVTEPGKGSDAANMATRLSSTYCLRGEKLLFGNGAAAPIGTVLVRTGDGALDMAAVLLPPQLVCSPAVTRQNLDMFAMPGAQLAYMRFDDLHVPMDMLLGRHLRATERGMMGLLKTFHRFRPGVSAMAIGHGQALVDYARCNFARGTEWNDRLDSFDHLLAVARALNAAAAAQVDANPLRGALASLAKSKATAAIEHIAHALRRVVPAPALVEHAWLCRSLADVWAYEYMEGTTAMQLNNVSAGYRRNDLAS